MVEAMSSTFTLIMATPTDFGASERVGAPHLPARWVADLEAVLDHLASDKKHAGGRLRWVLPTADGIVVRDDIEPHVVERAASTLLAAGSPR